MTAIPIARTNPCTEHEEMVFSRRECGTASSDLPQRRTTGRYACIDREWLAADVLARAVHNAQYIKGFGHPTRRGALHQRMNSGASVVRARMNEYPHFVAERRSGVQETYVQMRLLQLTIFALF